MIFATQFGDNRPKGSKEAFKKPSMTEPDNSMSIPEIIARYTRGQGLGVIQHPWDAGHSAPEGEEAAVPQDADLTQLLEMPAAPAAPAEPSAPAVPADPAAPAAPAPPAPAEPATQDPSPAPQAGA